MILDSPYHSFAERQLQMLSQKLIPIIDMNQGTASSFKQLNSSSGDQTAKIQQLEKELK